MVYSVAVQPDGKVVRGGYFASINGTNLNSVARLNTDGSVDSTFNPGTGPRSTVTTASKNDPLGREQRFYRVTLLP